MEKNYLPGPWMVVEDEEWNEIKVVQKDGYSPSFYSEICQVGQGLPEAYVIASAPELLEALERMCEACDKYNITEIAPEYEAARDAIAKAYGMEEG